MVEWDSSSSDDEWEEEDDEEYVEGEKEKANPLFVYPTLLPHAPSLSPPLQDWLIGLFRDDTHRARSTNHNYFKSLRPFWRRFEEALPFSLPPSFPLLTPEALREWLAETPRVLFVLLKVRDGTSSDGRAALVVMLSALDLKLTRPREGERRLVPLLEQERRDGRARPPLQEVEFSMLFRIFRRVSSLAPYLRRWLVRRLTQNKAYNTATSYMYYLNRTLLALQPSLPSLRCSTPASLQAAFLERPACVAAET
jgi:hypothetical protein